MIEIDSSSARKV